MPKPMLNLADHRSVDKTAIYRTEHDSVENYSAVIANLALHKAVVLMLPLLFCSGLSAADAKPTAIDSAMYFQADVRDAGYCSMRLVNGQLQAFNRDNGKPISNPAMTCPDMFSWKLFAEVVQDKFWSNWADEQQNWPAQPYPLCQSGQTPAANACCRPGDATNSTSHCPVFPGQRFAPQIKAFASAVGEKATAQARSKELNRHTRIPFHHQLNSLHQPAPADMLKADGSGTPSCNAVPQNGRQVDLVPAILKNFKPADAQSVGRIIRQTNAELTIRNQAFHDYLFRNNLYNADGALEVFFANQANLQQQAPYHGAEVAASAGNKGRLFHIDFPFDAVMIKSNWVHYQLINALGLPADSTAYASKYLSTQINLSAIGLSDDPKAQCNLQGPHYLVAFHISSKDTPNWVWTTFEHINLPGRCDTTGCNDAYGYQSADVRPSGTADNYVKPNQQSDKLNDSSIVFRPDAGYPLEKPRPEWQQLLAQLKIGTTADKDQHEPSPADSAWLNYRLKGSQVDFVTATGRPTMLGNSVTEAGFMDGSSCVSCHARAGVAGLGQKPGSKIPDGTATKHFLALSVFETSLSDFGYFRSHHGIPRSEWYHRDNNSRPELEVLQLDFVWGFLNAQPVVTNK